MKLSEYDSFGPWVYEIDEDHPVPPYFREYLNPGETPLLCVKIPIKKERRNVKPEMILYDKLVSLYERHMQILECDNKDIRQKRIEYTDVCAIEHSITLLRGELKIFLPEDVLSIEYNAVSKELMRSLAKIIRSRNAGEKDAKPISNVPKLQPFSFKFNSLLNRIREAEPDMQVITYQAERRVSYAANNVLMKLIEKVLAPTLLDAMYMSNGRELFILSQSDGLRFRSKPDYNLRYLYVPFGKIDSIAMSGPGKFDGIGEMAITVRSHRFAVLSEIENSGAELLKRLVA